MNVSISNQQRLGILVGGGPAPGINRVIASVTCEAIRHGWEVVGFYDGFHWLVRQMQSEGIEPMMRKLSVDDVQHVRDRGGSILRTSRENPAEDNAKLQRVVATLKELGIGYLVTIGGDDTAFSANCIARAADGAIRVAHVPKTIDNDLPLAGDTPTFGFRTACHNGARTVVSLLEDARTTNRWYILVAMGRSAGHLALGMGSPADAPITLIPEEFAHTKLSLERLCLEIEGSMIKARSLGQNYGVAVLAEGLGEQMETELSNHPLVIVSYDKHNHLRLSGVPLALIVARLLENRSKLHGSGVEWGQMTTGYELRCGDPISFDVHYAQQLGWAAVQYLSQPAQEHGALISIQASQLTPIPFPQVIDPETRRMKPRLVDINSDHYRCARNAMTRLELDDFQNAEQLRRLAQAAGSSTNEFCAEYGPVVGLTRPTEPSPTQRSAAL